LNLEKTERRFRKLLTDFRFSPMRRLVDDAGEGIRDSADLKN
jgi:hypothetical protein